MHSRLMNMYIILRYGRSHEKVITQYILKRDKYNARKINLDAQVQISLGTMIMDIHHNMKQARSCMLTNLKNYLLNLRSSSASK